MVPIKFSGMVQTPGGWQTQTFNSSAQALKAGAIDAKPIYWMLRGWVAGEDGYSRAQFKGKDPSALIHQMELTRKAGAEKVVVMLGKCPDWFTAEDRALMKCPETVAPSIIPQQTEIKTPTLIEYAKEVYQEKLDMKQIEQSYMDLQLTLLNGFFSNMVFEHNGKPLILGNVQVHEVDNSIIKAFFKSLQKQKTKKDEPISFNYQKQHLTLLRAVMNRAGEDERYGSLIQKLILKAEAYLPKDDTEPLHIRWTDDEIKKLASKAETPNELALLGISLLGVRPPGEIAGALWSNFEIDGDGAIWYKVETQIVFEGGKRVLRKTKTGKERVLPVHPSIWALLQPAKAEAEKRNAPFVVLGKKAYKALPHSVDPNYLRKEFRALAERAKVGVTFYSSRHTVTSLVAELKDSDTAELIGGWADTSTFGKHYSQVMAKKKLAGLVDLLPWGELLKPATDRLG